MNKYLEKVALNASKLREIAWSKRVAPLGDFKNAVSKLKNLTGKELAEKRIQMGMSSNNAWQKIVSKQKKVASDPAKNIIGENREIAGALDLKGNLVGKHTVGIGGAVGIDDNLYNVLTSPVKRMFHTHGYGTKEGIQKNIMNHSILSQRMLSSKAEGARRFLPSVTSNHPIRVEPSGKWKAVGNATRRESIDIIQRGKKGLDKLNDIHERAARIENRSVSSTLAKIKKNPAPMDVSDPDFISKSYAHDDFVEGLWNKHRARIDKVHQMSGRMEQNVTDKLPLDKIEARRTKNLEADTAAFAEYDNKSHNIAAPHHGWESTHTVETASIGGNRYVQHVKSHYWDRRPDGIRGPNPYTKENMREGNGNGITDWLRRHK